MKDYRSYIKENKSSWIRKHTKNGNTEMSSDDLATHRHYLDLYIDFKKRIKPKLEQMERNGIFDRKEWKKIEEAFNVLENAAYPASLIDLKKRK